MSPEGRQAQESQILGSLVSGEEPIILSEELRPMAIGLVQMILIRRLDEWNWTDNLDDAEPETLKLHVGSTKNHK